MKSDERGEAGDRCMAADSGLRAQHKPGTIMEALPTGYRILRDGEPEERYFPDKKVKHIRKVKKTQPLAPMTTRAQVSVRAIVCSLEWEGPHKAIPRPAKPKRSADYLAYVRAHPCCNPSCRAPAPSDPHHEGKRGVGQKCSYFQTVPLCRVCHRFYTDHNELPIISDHGQRMENLDKKPGRHSRADTLEIMLREQVRLLVAWVERSCQ